MKIKQKNTVPLWTQNWMKHNQISYYFFKKAKSSNDLAKDKAFQNLTSPIAFLVRQQSQGRGQKNNSWEDSDLMISFLWEKNINPIKTSSSLDYTKDLYQALKRAWSLPGLQVKAPNDLYLNNKKVSGILLEVLNQGSNIALIVGLGLNVFSCPKYLEAASLTEQEQNINSKTWFIFLDHLFSLWNQRTTVLTDPVR